jgi:2'-5' RNA ligase
MDVSTPTDTRHLSNHSNHLRTFFALKPEGKIISELTACIGDLQECFWSRQVRWITAGNMHMTLRFLGSTDPSIVADLLEEIRCHIKTEPIDYQIDEVLIFPSASRPRVIAATVAENDQLAELVGLIERSVQSYGFAAERKSFRGHFTLGRCRRDFPKRVTLDYPIEPARSQATEIVLYRSDTRPSGAVYSSLGTIRL